MYLKLMKPPGNYSYIEPIMRNAVTLDKGVTAFFNSTAFYVLSKESAHTANENMPLVIRRRITKGSQAPRCRSPPPDSFAENKTVMEEMENEQIQALFYI